MQVGPKKKNVKRREMNAPIKMRRVSVDHHSSKLK